MTENFIRISLSLDSELVNDINFEIMRIEGKMEPKRSYSKYFYQKLRPIVPHRNAQITDEGNYIGEPESTDSQ